MAKSGSAAQLDRTFAALSDPNRRLILDQLELGPASLSDLAAPLGISLPGVLKHVRALEDAHLVATHKQGRLRMCQLGPRPLDEANAWIQERRQRWQRMLDRFERHIEATASTQETRR